MEMNKTQTQQEIAVELGVPQPTINRWLSDNAHVGKPVKPNHRVTPPERDGGSGCSGSGNALLAERAANGGKQLDQLGLGYLGE